MKKYIKNLSALSALMLIFACSSDDKSIDEVFDSVERGAILRTVSLNSGSYNAFDDTSEFSVTLEEQDAQNGGLLDTVDVYVTFVDNSDDGIDTGVAEQLVETIPASAFSPSQFGLPEITYAKILSEISSSLGLTSDDYTGGDAFVYRFALNLTDGRTFTSTDVNGNVSGGSFFSSPFTYNVVVKCVPTAPVPGEYTINMNDAYGDGWNGAKLTVTIDGVATDYTLPSGSSGSETFTVPDGATEFFIVYSPGDWEVEVTYSIIAPNGDTAISDGPGPFVGELVLNICP